MESQNRQRNCGINGTTITVKIFGKVEIQDGAVVSAKFPHGVDAMAKAQARAELCGTIFNKKCKARCKRQCLRIDSTMAIIGETKSVLPYQEVRVHVSGE